MRMRVTGLGFSAETQWSSPVSGVLVCVQADAEIREMTGLNIVGMELDTAIAFFREKGLDSYLFDHSPYSPPFTEIGPRRLTPGERLAVMKYQCLEIERAHRDALFKSQDTDDSLFSVECRVQPPPAVTHTLQVKNEPEFRLPKIPPLNDIFKAIVKGENAKVFRLLEHNINTMRENGSIIHLLLVGPPSVGKTTTAQIASRALDRKMLPMSGATMCSDLFEIVDSYLTTLHKDHLYSEIYKHPDSGLPVYRVAPSILFVDEAHQMPKRMQTALLMATEAPHVIPNRKGHLIDFRDVMLILGTTDPSLSPSSGGLVRPLRTRCLELVFQAYSITTVAEIIVKKFPYLSFSDSISFARASKLVPRLALSYAKQAEDGRVTPETFLRDYLGVDSEGLDAIDQRLLETLRNSYTAKNSIKFHEATLLIEAANNGARVTTAQLTKAKALIDHKEFKPLSIAALADRLQVTDKMEVQNRVHYLELLGMVERTPRGVVLKN